jgi:hypothetical protein
MKVVLAVSLGFVAVVGATNLTYSVRLRAPNFYAFHLIII